MCFKFKKKLPHPEEEPDYSKTKDNVDIDEVFQKWFEVYKVPLIYRDYWRNSIEIEIDDTLSFPAGVWDIPNGRHLSVRPEYFNVGVIAHEQAHNSYALLSQLEKTNFAITYHALKNTDSYIKLLYSINTYGLTSDIEGHAEIYRYICEKLPDEIKSYYPKLF